MLIRFITRNFLSFEEEIEFCMVTSNKTRKNPDHKIMIKGVSTLRYATIYGGNAAGKSNLIKAIGFGQNCVTQEIPKNAPNLFCKRLLENSEKESEFSYHLMIDGRFYAYGFTLLLQKREVISEWLYELPPKKDQILIFERGKETGVEINPEYEKKDSDKNRLLTYLDDFSSESSMLFLTFMNRNKKIPATSKLLIFQKIYQWFEHNLDVCTPQTSLRSLECYYDNESMVRISELIKTFDTGITEVGIEEISKEKFEKEISLYPQAKAKIDAILEHSTKKQLTARIGLNFFNFQIEEDGSIKIYTIRLKHGEMEHSFSFNEESDGTRRLFELIDMLLNETTYKVYVVDELERSLHPKLTARFLTLFHEAHINHNTQLIFTTHEASIMNQDLFRRDEIWFVERDARNISSMCSLEIFKERYDKEIGKAYLDGRYGGIPVFKNFPFEGAGKII